jgi:hypothetical protein
LLLAWQTNASRLISVVVVAGVAPQSGPSMENVHHGKVMSRSDDVDARIACIAIRLRVCVSISEIDPNWSGVAPPTLFE